MVELYSFPKDGNKKLLNISAFCAKTEAFLKFNKIEYSYISFTGDPGKFPKGKLPVIKHNGSTVCDSWFIEQYLSQNFNIDMDKSLSTQDKGISFAFKKMFDEYLYWTILNERWMVDKNFSQLVNKFFTPIPKVMRKFVAKIVRKSQAKNLKGHGMGRHSQKEIINLGAKCLESFSNLLRDKKFSFGEQITSLDITAWSYLSNVKYVNLNPEIKNELEKYPNLLTYVDRVGEHLKLDQQ